MSTASRPIRRRPGWLAVIGASVAIFLVVLALLWVRMGRGEDPALAARTPAAHVSTAGTDSSADTASDDGSSSATAPSPSTGVPATHAS